jgi:hypothetical protein
MAAVPGILRKWNPGIVPGLALWVDATDSSTLTMANTSNISAISDKSGLNIQLVQDVQANQPFLTSNVNNLQTIGFARSNFVSTTTTYFPSLFNNTSNISQFTVFNSRSNNLFQGITSIVDSTGVNQFSLGTQANNLRLFKTGANATIPISMRLSNVFMEGFLENNEATILHLSCNSTVSINNIIGPILNNLSQFFIGRRPGASIFYGDIGEILFYNNNAYTTNSPFNPQIEGYLAWKWGLVGSLSNGHPYKRRPPS